MEKNLQNTKKKLTIIFTIIVFFIIVFLEFIFFTGKYFNYTGGEKDRFSDFASGFKNRFLSLEDLNKNFELGRMAMRFNNRDFKKGPQRDDFINILVFKENSNKLVFGNIIDQIDENLVLEKLENQEYNKISQDNGYILQKIDFVELGQKYDVIFIKKLKYSFYDYLFDLFGFVFVTFIFSLLLYYIGYGFINKILKPVEQNLKDMQDFVHNAGHELKTPISVISSNLQLLNEIKKYDAELTKESLEEIKKLDKLIEGLVELSDINSISGFIKIDLKAEIEAIIGDFKKQADEKNIKIDLIVRQDFQINFNKQYFYIFFSNLLLNAIKYTNNEGKIEIILDKKSLEIKDNGIGINKENLDKIFDRFYKEDTSRHSKGYGIGLSLVKKIAQIYKLKIQVKSEKGVGTSFLVEF